jgi:ribosomal protein L11 methyltransferase
MESPDGARSAPYVATSYLRRVFEVPAASAELLIAALAEAGTLGLEELVPDADVQRLVAYFADEASEPTSLPAGTRLLEESRLAAGDWLAGYRAAARPLLIGEHFVLDPREPDQPPPEGSPGRILLRIPARSAFGTGSHASTRLALRLLERLPLAGAAVLDVGTGSGVLALAALALGAARAVGLDVDLAAALLAGQHARLNHLLAARFWAGALDALSPAARFGAVLVNALPHEVLPEAPRLAAAAAPGGRLLVSGVLASEAEVSLAAWARQGFSPVDALAEEEWVAWTLARA